MSILRIDHVQLAMPAGQEDLARAFYGGLLGLAETPKPAALAGRGGVWFESGGVHVHLGVEADFRPARKAHPAFVVSNLATMVESLRGGGCETAAAELLEGRLRTFVHDPFGNRIELVDSVVLRTVRSGDLDRFFAHQLEPGADRMAAFMPRDPADREVFDTHWAGLLDDDTVMLRTVVLDDVIAGYVTSFNRDGRREVAYWIGKKHWGTGVASRALTGFLLQETSRPLYGAAAQDNRASIRVLQKNGFEICAHERAFARARGEEIDEVVLRLDREDR